MIVAASVLSNTPDALTGAAIQLEEVIDNIKDAIGPPLAKAGIALIDLKSANYALTPR